MLPSVIASELEQVACDAIRTAFHPTTPGFRCEHQVGSTNADLTQGFAGFVPLARTVGRH
jgi:hypothetical protein